MPSITVENYLKTILHAQQSSTGRVAMGHLASAMNIAPGTATAMVKALADSGLADYAPREGVLLTTQGTKLALLVVRRHRLVELFLVEVLHFNWDEVHDEAEELEHTVSQKVLERIDEFLGYPDTDPHGDPIPPSTGKLAEQSTITLTDCDLSRPMVIQRVLDQDRQFLKFADKNNLVPSQVITVTSRNSAADSVKVRLSKTKKTLTLGSHAAAKILVAPVNN